MGNILCSIIIPYYNVPTEYVNRCLNSILNQNWEDNHYEVIFINDGSQMPIHDSTKEIFKRFPKFTLIEQENQGLSSARNAGIKAAEGKYLFFVDSDDYWIDNKIQSLTPFLFTGNHDIIKFRAIHLQENTQFLSSKDSLSTTLFMSGSDYMKSNNLIKSVWTYCYNRDFIIKHNLTMPDGLIHEDEWFLTTTFLYAKSIIFTNITLYAYIKRDNSIMHRKTKEQYNFSLFNYFETIKMVSEISHLGLTQTQIDAIKNRLSYLIYDYYYNTFNSPLSEDDKQLHIYRLKEINLYPLPNIGNNKKYNLLRICSKNKFLLKLYIKTIHTINKYRLNGKIY